MPAPPVMKHCPVCTAPNPASRTQCYACGASLTAAPETPPPLPTPSAPQSAAANSAPQTYPCAFCAMPIPSGGKFCVTCGKPQPQEEAAPPPPAFVSAPTSPPPAAAPHSALEMQLPRTPLPGWKVERTPNHAIRLERTTGGRFLRDAWVPFGLILLSLFFGMLFVLRGIDIGFVAAGGFGFLAFVSLLAFALSLVWAFGSQEELTVAYKSMTYRRSLGKWEKAWTIEGQQAQLRIETVVTRQDLHRRGTETTRTLYAEFGSQSQVVDRRTSEGTWYGVKVRSASGMLSDALGGANWGDEMVLISRYLSEQTGWPVVSDDRLASPTQ